MKNTEPVLSAYADLAAAVKDFKTIARNISQLDALEKQAHKELDEAAAKGDLDKESDLQKHAFAVSKLALVPTRRRQYLLEEATAQAQLQPLFEKASRSWAEFVQARFMEEFGRFVAAVTPFFDSRREILDKFSPDEIHSCYPIRLARFEAGLPTRLSFAHQLCHAQDFVRHVKRHCRKFQWNFAGLQPGELTED